MNNITFCRELRSDLLGDQRVAFVSGNFNIVHPGHLRLLKFASEIASSVIVGLNPDGHAGVTVPLTNRLDGVRALSMVSHVLALDGALVDVLKALRPDFVVKGREFEGQPNVEDEVVATYGGQVVYSSGELRFSDMALLQREFKEHTFSSIQKPMEYPSRHGFGLEDIKTNLAKINGIRVLVIGDLIIDDYITCEPLGMSQEDPTIVVSPVDTKTFVGGAGVVSGHAKGFGADVHFCTVVGQDVTAEFARSDLEGQGVTLDFAVDQTRPTPRKQRYRAHNKTLLRVNHLRQHAIGGDLIARFLKSVERRLPATDLLLFSDFNYGCLPQPLVDAIVERAAARGVMMAADSQASSQFSDVSRFKGMTLITPTEREARLAMSDFTSGLAFLSERLAAKAGARHVVITLGSEGLIVWGETSPEVGADRLPALNSAPKDPAGAGDSLFTSMALALRSGVDIWQSTYIGALAAACQVSRVGNAPLTIGDVISEIDAPCLQS